MFVTIFPSFKNFHFFKDPGQIPYRFSKNNFFKKSMIVTNRNSKYNLDRYTDNNFSIYCSKFKPLGLGIIYFLLFNSRKISVLHVQHISWPSLFNAFVYKLLNKNGFVYLKLDNCNHASKKFYAWESKFNNKITENNILNPEKKYWNSNIKDYFFPNLIDFIDLFSVEDESSCNHYINSYNFLKDKLIVSHNGTVADILYTTKLKSFDEKNNIIVSAGRLGSYEKATEHLVEAFCLISGDLNWELHLAGPTTKEFNFYVEDLLKNNKSLSKKIILHGNLNQIELYNLLNSSKIFCLPSRFDAWACVYSEAMYFSNAVVTTDTTSVRDVVKKYKLGKIVKPENSKELSLSLKEIIYDSELNKNFSINSRNFYEKNLNWDLIVSNINKSINKKK